jgi:hypothetical protein
MLLLLLQLCCCWLARLAGKQHMLRVVLQLMPQAHHVELGGKLSNAGASDLHQLLHQLSLGLHVGVQATSCWQAGSQPAALAIMQREHEGCHLLPALL